ncbi:hypothetical protein [Roseinatronobacter monicus]|uniref:Uncharacterized protein n=1 Tax=Roseinatronobacter monicus TaxID=393481 RepID=A0A543K490_9RHOB|nr:hypothetical protein [Roseinatronobacter monicus]TQM89875.1 hypothetical protein BD293_4184 [Roseinatronobacter monicus]
MKRLPMRKIRDVLRLSAEGRSTRQIAGQARLSPQTTPYVMRFDGDSIAHMTKIWNDAQALHQLGWMRPWSAR